MTKKFNWGHGIALAYTAFAFGMIFLVYMYVIQKIELVDKDYYSEELKFQQRIDQKQNTAALAQRLEVVYSRENASVEIKLPEEVKNTNSVNVHLYKPNDASLDKRFTQASENNLIRVNTQNLKSGLWRLELSWQCDGKDFFHETILNL